jgi:hypothetical protein
MVTKTELFEFTDEKALGMAIKGKILTVNCALILL